MLFLEELGVKLRGHDGWQLDLVVDAWIERFHLGRIRPNRTVLDCSVAAELHPDLHAIKLLEAQVASAVSSIIGLDRLRKWLRHKVLEEVTRSRLLRVVLFHFNVARIEGVLFA